MFYIARMTHNYNNNWEKPSGPNYKSPNGSKHRFTKEALAFEAQYKFGFEEWFRCERHVVDGYQYAYIESLEAHHCKAKILLHTIRHNEGNKKSDRTLVGVLHKSEYYTDWTDVGLQDIADLFYKDMRSDLQEALKLHPKELQVVALEELKQHKNYIAGKGKPLFNVRYKKNDFDYIFSKQIDSAFFTSNKRFGIEEITTAKFQTYPASVQQILSSLGLVLLQNRG